MATINLCFQVHQPYLLRPFSFFEIGTAGEYFDHEASQRLLGQVAARCYLPANRKMLELINRYPGKFKFSLLMSGVLIEQLERHFPEVLASFQELVATGSVELLAGTYYHSLSFLYSRKEFFSQVIMHRNKMWEHFQQNPTVLANAALLHGNHLAYFSGKLGIHGAICEGFPAAYHNRNPNHLYHPPDLPLFNLMPRNQGLSLDLAQRFSDTNWEHFPLHPHTYANWLRNSGGDLITLFLEYENLGHFHSVGTGVFPFWEQWVETWIHDFGNDFQTSGQVIKNFDPVGGYDATEFGTEIQAGLRLQPGKADPVQEEALRKIHEMEEVVLAHGDSEKIRRWSLLQAVEYFSDMSRPEKGTLEMLSGRPAFYSPYDAYIYYLNIISDFQLQLRP